MSILLNPNIKISEFKQAINSNGVQKNKFLIQCEHLNYIVSSPVKLLIEALLTSQKLNISISESYFLSSKKQTSADEIMDLASQHIPSELFAEFVIPAPRTPFVFSMTLLPERLLRHLSVFLTPLFSKWFTSIMVLLFIVVHGVLFSQISQSSLIGIPSSDTPTFVTLMLLSYFIHELGHISACRRYNCPHGEIGMGIYLIFPVFYADVSKAWRLSGKQRAVVDLGGLYFQAILLIIIDLHAYIYSSDLAYLLSWTITFTMLHTLNPFFKFDGYWLLSDLSGITNLHEKMRKALQAIKNKILHQTPINIQQDKSLYLLIPYSLLTMVFFIYVATFLTRKLVQTSQDIAIILDEFPNENLFESISYIVAQGDIWTLVKGVLWIALICLLLTFYAKRIASLLYSTEKKIRE